MKNTIENAETFLRQLQGQIGKPMNSTTELFWSEALVEYGKLLQADVSGSVCEVHKCKKVCPQCENDAFPM